jgi:predicted Ser/Thr protein kinase
MLQQNIIARQRDTIVVHFELAAIKLVPRLISFS